MAPNRLGSDVPSLPVPARLMRMVEARARLSQSDLASRTDAGRDVLHYLAQHGETATRQAVAANRAAAPETNLLLTEDGENEVRIELAKKIARLMPGLAATHSDRIGQLTLAALERLAADQEPRVRAALAQEIRTMSSVPLDVVRRLARDLDAIVAAPILEYSPLLGDADLLEIIAYAQAQDALASIEAIARRRPLHADVADAVATSLDIPSVTALLTNPDADIRDATLEFIITEARGISGWHQPLALRLDLSQRAIRRIAGFVGTSLLDLLASRSGLDAETASCLGQALRERLQGGDREAYDAILADARDSVAEAKRTGQLGARFVEAEAEAGRRESVILALSELASVSPEKIRRVLLSGMPKPVTALVWRAGLGMRTAVRIQVALMKLPPSVVLQARLGTDFPLSRDEMHWHLAYFDISA